MNLDSHDLYDEFPEYREKIDRLKTANPHFAILFGEYHKVNSEVRSVEENDVPVSDVIFEELKKRRLKLKDELYALLVERAS